MEFLKANRAIVIIGLVLTTAFFISRLYNLGTLPIFTDEAIYVRWAQIAKNDPAWRFISLTDGKQPLFIWGIMVAMRFVEDPLLAGRVVSLVAGFFTSIGLFFLARQLFKNMWIGMLSSFLYILYPFAVVYDRMALYDSLVGTFAIWSILLVVLLVEKMRIDVALLLGMVLGVGVLNKTSGFISAYLIPLGVLLFDLKGRNRLRRLARLTLLAMISFFLMYLYYAILRLSPFFHIVDEKNTIFYYPIPIEDWLASPTTFFGSFFAWFSERLKFFVGNILGLWDWFITYATWSFILLISAAFAIDRKYLREKVFLLLWFFVPFVVLALIGKVLYPRFIFFMTLYLLPLAAYSLYRIRSRVRNTLLYGGLCLLLFSLPFVSDYYIVFDFARVPIPKSDRGQYINGWPAGGGVKEAIVFFEEEAKKGKVFVMTQGTFGLFPYAFEIYLKDNPNVTISSFWPVPETPPQEAVEKNSTMRVYIVFYQPCPSCPSPGEAPVMWKLERVAQFKKGTGQESTLTIYRLPPQ